MDSRPTCGGTPHHERDWDQIGFSNASPSPPHPRLHEDGSPLS